MANAISLSPIFVFLANLSLLLISSIKPQLAGVSSDSLVRAPQQGQSSAQHGGRVGVAQRRARKSSTIKPHFRRRVRSCRQRRCYSHSWATWQCSCSSPLNGLRDAASVLPDRRRSSRRSLDPIYLWRLFDWVRYRDRCCRTTYRGRTGTARTCRQRWPARTEGLEPVFRQPASEPRRVPADPQSGGQASSSVVG